MGHTGDKEPAVKLWCSWEPEGAGTEQMALAGRPAMGLAAQTGTVGKHWSLQSPRGGYGFPTQQ